MKRVANYTRISTSNGQQAHEDQLQTILQAGKRMGELMTVEEFKDWLRDLLASASDG